MKDGDQFNIEELSQEYTTRLSFIMCHKASDGSGQGNVAWLSAMTRSTSSRTYIGVLVNNYFGCERQRIRWVEC